MTWRHFQQFIYAVACGVIFITRQLQANASDFYRDRIISGQFGSTLKVLVGTSFVTALLSSFCRQQVIHYRLFCMIGVFRHQLFNLLIIAFCQLEQRLLRLLTGATTLPTDKPSAGMRASAENSAQQPFNRKQDDHCDDQNDHQTRHAGFDIVIIRLDQYVALMTGNHWTDNDPGD